ncbi:hypothetical protein IAD21_04217 [Abditibacteriota bacterium]|nr:hypothetical protein IAD21_04217 [Abditibacteriota bacterium]
MPDPQGQPTELDTELLPLANSEAEADDSFGDVVAQPYPIGEPLDPGDSEDEDMGDEPEVRI